MSNLEKKVDALCRMVLAQEDAAWDAARAELEALMGQPETAVEADALNAHICKVLLDLGVPTGILGHKYLVDAIRQAVEAPTSVRHMTKEGGTYVAVAEMNGTTPGRAERAIRHGIEEGWKRMYIDDNLKYFGGSVSPDKGKPTNREYITRLAQYLRLQNCEV